MSRQAPLLLPNPVVSAMATQTTSIFHRSLQLAAMAREAGDRVVEEKTQAQAQLTGSVASGETA